MLNTILQIIFISGPQAVLTVVFCLLFTDNFDLITFDEVAGKIKLSCRALLRLSIPVSNLSILSIVLRHLRFDLWVAPPIMIISTVVLMLAVYRMKRLNDVVKLFIAICLWYVIGGITELLVIPLVIDLKRITVYDVFDSFSLNFMTSIPLIVITLVINVVLFTKRKNYLNINVVKSIARSRITTSVALFLILVNLSFISIYSMLINDRVLDVYPTNAQMTIKAILIMFPAINLGGLYILLYGVKFKEAMDKRSERDKLIKEMTVAKERNRLAMDLRDTLGHSLTLTIKLLEVCKVTSKTDIGKIDMKLEEAIKIAQEGANGVKHSVSGILGEKILNKDLISSLTELANEFEENSGISVDVSVQGEVEAINKKYTVVLYSICQEAMINSLRHGKAKNIAIIIRFDSKVIKLSIFDDGVGCGKINKGFGLKGMEQRIKELNGKMSYNSDKGEGFILNFEVPREEVA